MGRMCTGIFDGFVDCNGFQDPSMALVRLKWGCAALGKRWPAYRSAAACRSLAIGDINIVAIDS